MDDYLKRQQELLQSIEESSGIRSLRNMEETLRRTLEPFRMPYMNAVTKIAADMQHQCSVSEQIRRSIVATDVTPALEEAMRSVIPASFRTLSEVMTERNEHYRTYLNDAVHARTESLRLLTKVGDEIAAFGVSPIATNRLVAEIQAISNAARYMQPGTSAILATAMRGWDDMLSIPRETGVFSALSNPMYEVAHEMHHAAVRLARTDDPEEIRALEAVVAIGDVEVRTAEDLVRTFAPADGRIGVVPQRRLAAPRRHRAELARIGEALQDIDAREALTLIPSGQIALIARELLVVVSEINYSRELAGTTVIFTPTVRLQRVAAELPFALAQSASAFAEIIDDLFWLLCESPGSEKPQFLIEHGGVLTREESEIFYVIKRLRNHLRHDPDHGTPGEIAKKYKRVLADLNARGFDGWPRTRAEFTALQRVLLEEAVAFVARLRDRL